MATSVGEIALDLILNSEQFEERVTQIAKKTSETTKESLGFADSLSKVGGASTTVGTALVGLSAPITGIGIASAKSAITFEDSMAKVMTIADQTQVSYEDMERAIIDLSDQTGISANIIADNVYDAISAGQQTGDAVNFVTESTKLARAGFADAGAALDILTTILNAYGLEAKEVTNVSDMLIQTQNVGKVTVGELSAAMGKVIPTAKANNVALDQICSGYALMTSNGVACAESTTYMNSMLNELGKKGTAVSDVLKAQTGQSFSELMASGASLGDVLAILNDYAKQNELAFTDLWGSAEAGKAGLILLGNEGEEFNKTLTNMNACSGATDTAFKTLETTSFSMQKAVNEVKNAAISLGGVLMEELAPVISSVCAGVSRAVQWFSGLSDGTKKAIFIIGGLITILGTSLIVIGKVATGVSSLITAVSTMKTVLSALHLSFAAFNPTVLIVVASITALIAIGVALYQNWDVIKEKLGQLGQFFSEVWDGIKAGMSKFGEDWQTMWEGVADYWREKWIQMKTKASEIWNNIKTSAINIFKSIGTGISNTISGIKTSIVNGFNNAVGYITSLPSKAVQWGKDMIQGIINGIKGMLGNVGNAAKSVADKIASFLHFSCPDVGPLSTYEEWMPDFMTGLSKGIDKNKSLVTNAIKGLSNDMSLSLETPELKNVSPTPIVSNVQNEHLGMFEKLVGMFEAQNSGDIVIPVYVGGDLIDEIVVKAQDRRRLRSGGLA